MTLAKLKTVCAAYLGKTSGALTIDGVDMFLEAANNVRKNAELLHDFEYTRVLATLDIDGANGVALSEAVIVGGNLTVTGGVNAASYVRVGSLNGEPVFIASALANQGVLWYSDEDEAWILQSMADYPSVSAGYYSETKLGTYTSLGGGYTGSPVVAEASRFSGLKSIVNISRGSADGSFIPLDLTRADIAVERERTEMELGDEFGPETRYPSDAQFLNRVGQSTLTLRGGQLLVYPRGTESTGTITVSAEGFGWLSDYTASDLTLENIDLFVEHGHRFLKWAIICELNYLFQRFVPRQEGVLSPPEQAKEMAWRDLLLWDSYLVDPNSTRSR